MHISNFLHLYFPILDRISSVQEILAIEVWSCPKLRFWPPKFFWVCPPPNFGIEHLAQQLAAVYFQWRWLKTTGYLLVMLATYLIMHEKILLFNAAEMQKHFAHINNIDEISVYFIHFLKNEIRKMQNSAQPSKHLLSKISNKVKRHKFQSLKYRKTQLIRATMRPMESWVNAIQPTQLSVMLMQITTAYTVTRPSYHTWTQHCCVKNTEFAIHKILPSVLWQWSQQEYSAFKTSLQQSKVILMQVFGVTKKT